MLHATAGLSAATTSSLQVVFGLQGEFFDS